MMVLSSVTKDSSKGNMSVNPILLNMTGSSCNIYTSMISNQPCCLPRNSLQQYFDNYTLCTSLQWVPLITAMPM